MTKQKFILECTAHYGHTCCYFETDEWKTDQDGIDIFIHAECPNCGCGATRKFSIEDVFSMVNGSYPEDDRSILKHYEEEVEL